jgi:hypothetical protein
LGAGAWPMGVCGIASWRGTPRPVNCCLSWPVGWIFPQPLGVVAAARSSPSSQGLGSPCGCAIGPWALASPRGGAPLVPLSAAAGSWPLPAVVRPRRASPCGCAIGPWALASPRGGPPLVPLSAASLGPQPRGVVAAARSVPSLQGLGSPCGCRIGPWALASPRGGGAPRPAKCRLSWPAAPRGRGRCPQRSVLAGPGIPLWVCDWPYGPRGAALLGVVAAARSGPSSQGL